MGIQSYKIRIRILILYIGFIKRIESRHDPELNHKLFSAIEVFSFLCNSKMYPCTNTKTEKEKEKSSETSKEMCVCSGARISILK